MITRLSILFFLLFIITSCSGQKEEGKLVQKSFELYKTAILNDKGEDAVKQVDSRTIKYYSDMLEKIKFADSTEVNSLSIIDKVMVFAVRHRASKEDILSFDGKGLIVYAVENSMIGKNSVANNTVGNVEIDGDFAKGEFVVNGQKAESFYLHFYKEEGKWKIDLTAIFAIGAEAFTQLQKESGLNENEFLFSILEYLTGRKPGSEIWNTFEE